MEYPCHKCGQAVEEGKPFCANCGAPQIRVLIEQVADVAPSGEAAAVFPSTVARPASETIPILAVPMSWSQALKPCALAAVVATVLTTLGLHPLVAMLSVGFLAVLFYRQGHAGFALRTATCVQLGAFSGLLSFGITVLIAALAVMVPDLRSKVQAQIVENAEKWASAHPGDPQVQSALEQLKTPEGFVMILIVGGVLLLVLSLVLGGVGGAVGGAIFGRRKGS